MKMRSIKTKLMSIMGAVVLTICLGLGIIAFVACVMAMGDAVRRDIRTMAEQTAETVGLSFHNRIDNLKNTASVDVMSKLKTDEESKNRFLKEQAEKVGAKNYGICAANGEARFSDGTVINISDQEYFQTVMNGDIYISDPQPSALDGSIVIVYAVPIKYEENVVGAVFQENDGNEYSELVNKKVFGKTGQSFILNSEGTFVAHTNHEFVNAAYNPVKDGKDKELAELIESINLGEVGSQVFRAGGEKLNAGYAPVEGTDWMVAVTITHEEVYAPLTKLFYQMVLATLVFAIIAGLIVYFFSRSMAKQLKMTSGQLEKMAEGDLTSLMEENNVKRKDEIGQMTESLQVMQKSVSGIVSNIKENSTALSDKSVTLSSDSEEISKLSGTISNAINEIAEGTSMQSGELITITEILEQFNLKLQSMFHEIEMVDGTSKKIDEMAVKSSDEMNELNVSINHIRDTFAQFEKSIVSLGGNITEIDKITTMITDVANQTNLLALNASIEAARAGEAGKGFAVVAQEIGSLAEQSKTSSASINTLISNIAANTEGIVSDAKGMGSELQEQVDTISRSIKTFQMIINEIAEVIPKIQNVKTSGQEINQDKNAILTKIDELSAVSEEICASSEEIAASTDEMNLSIVNVAESAKMLHDMTDEMMEQVNQFQV